MIPINELITKVQTRNIKSILTNVFIGSGGGGAVSSVSGTSNQITVSPTIGATIISLPSNVIFPGTWQIGTLGYSDTGILFSAQSSTNSYNQAIIQNTSNGAAASTNFNVSNDQGTATANFGEFGINSSGFTGSGAFSQPGNVYLAAATADLAIGTYGAKAIHFVINSGAIDAITISSSQNITVNQLAQSSGQTFLSFNQASHSGGVQKFVTFTGGNSIGITAATEQIDFDFVPGSGTWIDGTVVTQRGTYFRGKTYNKTTTSATFTNAYTVYIDPSVAGSGVSITNNMALGVNGTTSITNGNFSVTSTSSNVIISAGQTISFTGRAFSGFGSTTTFTFNPGASINIATTQEWTSFVISQVTLQWASGTVVTQRHAYIKSVTYTGSSATAIFTDAYGLYIDPPVQGSNATITNNWCLGLNGNLKIIGTRLNAANLPTSSAGLASGDMWKNGNVINII